MEAKRMSKHMTEQQAKEFLDSIKIKRQQELWQIKLMTFLFGFMMWMFVFILDLIAIKHIKILVRSIVIMV
jgi:hypothetical protein